MKFNHSLTFLHHIRDIKDPEHPYSLEELKVITEDAVEVDDERSYARWKMNPFQMFLFWFSVGGIFMLSNKRKFFDSGLHSRLPLNIAAWQLLLDYACVWSLCEVCLPVIRYALSRFCFDSTESYMLHIFSCKKHITIDRLLCYNWCVVIILS